MHLRRSFIYPVTIFIALSAAGIASAAWSGPCVGTPSTCNAAGPVDLSGNPQTKPAGLILNNLGTYTNGLIVYGNTGIGEPNPLSRLHVTGSHSNPALNSSVGSLATFTSDTSVQLQFGAIIGGSYASWIQSKVDNQITAYPLVLQPAGGNVGIGTGLAAGTPAYKLDVAGDINLSAGSCVRYNGTCITTGGGQWTTSGTNIYSANTGNVGVGTSNPGAKLEVNGNIKLSPANPSLSTGGSYLAIPYGIYISGGTAYFENEIKIRGGISNDQSSTVNINDNMVVSGAINAQGFNWGGTSVCYENGSHCPPPPTSGSASTGYLFGGMYTVSSAAGSGTGNALNGGQQSCNTSAGYGAYLGATINTGSINYAIWYCFK